MTTTDQSSSLQAITELVNLEEEEAQPSTEPSTTELAASEVVKSSVWKSHVNAAGRTYYYNTLTNATQWTRPEGFVENTTPLLTTATSDSVGLLASTPPTTTCAWKEFKNEVGRPYYYNKVTKVTQWTRPKEMDQVSALPPSASTETRVGLFKAGPTPSTPAPVELPFLSGANQQPVIRRDVQNIFRELLDSCNVDPSWPWEEVMRHTLTHPDYKVLPNSTERKACWLKWQEERIRQLERERQERFERNQETMIWLLKGGWKSQHMQAAMVSGKQLKNDEKRNPLPVALCTTLKEVQGWLVEEPAFTEIPEENQMKIWMPFIAEFRQKERDRMEAVKQRTIPHYRDLLASIPEISHQTTWQCGRALIEASSDFSSVVLAGGLDELDMLIGFEEYILHLDKEHASAVDRGSKLDFRKERHRREAFKSTLADLASQGLIHAKSKWKDLFPYFENGPAYQDMVGQKGSTPIELVWDLIDAAEQIYFRDRSAIERFLMKSNVNVDVVDTEGQGHFETFLARLPSNSSFSIASLQAFYLDALTRQKARALATHEAAMAVEAAKLGGTSDPSHYRHHRALERYKEYVMRYHDYSFDRIERRCEEKPEFSGISQEERWSIYEKYADADMVRREWRNGPAVQGSDHARRRAEEEDQAGSKSLLSNPKESTPSHSDAPLPKKRKHEVTGEDDVEEGELSDD